MRDVTFETQTGLSELYGLIGLVSALLIWRFSIPPGVLTSMAVIQRITRAGVLPKWLPRTKAQVYCRSCLLALGLVLTITAFYKTWRYLQLLELVAGNLGYLDDGMFERVLECVALLRRETIHIGFVAAGLFVLEAIVNGVPFRRATESDVPQNAHTFVLDGNAGVTISEVWERRLEYMRRQSVRARLPTVIVERLDVLGESQPWCRDWADWHLVVTGYTIGLTN